MALPREVDNYETITDSLVYFRARLRANPLTSPLSAKIDEAIDWLDASFVKVRDLRRTEIELRAVRDFKDTLAESTVKDFSRDIRAAAHDATYVIEKIFARSLNWFLSPRGRAQIERLDVLLSSINQAIATPRLDAEPKKEKIRGALQSGLESIQGLKDDLAAAVATWEEKVLELGRMKDEFDYYRSEAVNQAGATLGELRALLKGNQKEAYGYTQPGRSRGSDDADEVDVKETPPDTSSTT